MTSWYDLMRPLWAAGLALLVMCMSFRGAAAHADYERSEPPAGAVVAEAPTEVRIHFTQDLFRRQRMNGIEVYSADGARVDQDDAVIDDDNRRLMHVTLQPDLPDGLYTVRWFSLSAEDGHEGEGEFTFTVAAAEAATSAAPVTTTATVTPTGEVTTSEIQATEAVTVTVPDEPTAATPTPSPASSGIPCLGGTVPFGLVLGLLWFGRRRLY